MPGNYKSFQAAMLLGCLTATAFAHDPQRAGITELMPRNSNPDDAGLYNAFIDVPHGYAYFLGNYLWKLCITNDLPYAVCAPTNTGGSSYAQLDSACGYAYISRPTTLYRYSLGAGTNAVTGAGSLTVSGVNSIGEVSLDDSDPDPANHNLYVFCRINGAADRVDHRHGYIYYATIAAGGTNTDIVKIKMTPGTNPPIRIASVNIGMTNEPIGFGALDDLNGYAYYGTYGSTNYPSRIYKLKLGDSDNAPSLVGHIDLAQGRAQLSVGTLDPTNGFLYYGNDNTFPGGVHWFKLNGTNLPVEMGYRQFNHGPSNNPPDTTSVFNYTTNADGTLPYGEVYLKSVVFDPIRGNIFFGQDSKPNQVVMVHVARPDPFTLTAAQQPNGAFQVGFTNILGGSFSVFTSTNLALPLTNWTSLGSVTDSPPGQFQFTDPRATNGNSNFYRVQSP
jgi:hypothetical protein